MSNVVNVSLTALLIGDFIIAGLSFAAGYYLSHRGWSGVKSDLEDIKEDVSKVKAKVTKK